MCSPCLCESNKKKNRFINYDIFIISEDIAMGKSSRDTLHMRMYKYNNILYYNI